jgi:hypothetical protein
MNEKPILSVKKHVEALKSPANVIMDPALGQQLMNKFSQMYQVSPEDARRFYEREKDNFGKMISQNAELNKCTPMSAFLAFGKVMALKLTFDNRRAPLIYLIPGNRNIGTKENPTWIKEMVAQPSPEGEKEVRITTGILKRVDQPIIVHEGDTFQKYLDEETGQLKVKYAESAKPSTKIIASFIRIVEPDGTVVYKTFNLTDIERWKAASAKKNRGTANSLYTSGINNQIDEGFLKGKTLLHSFKGYKQVDYAYATPGGFVPDKEQAALINPDFTNEDFTEYTEEDAVIVDTKAPDELAEAVNEAPEEKASVKVTPTDDDDLFNN